MPRETRAWQGSPAALSPMEVANVSCSMPLANARGKPLKGNGTRVMLIGRFPPRSVTVVLAADNTVTEFHSLVSGASGKQIVESVEGG